MPQASRQAATVASCCVSHGRTAEHAPELTLEQAQATIATALKYGTDQKLQPLAVVVLDARGVLKAFAAQDGTSLRRAEIAQGKAHGALAFGIGSRALANGRRRRRNSLLP